MTYFMVMLYLSMKSNHVQAYCELAAAYNIALWSAIFFFVTKFSISLHNFYIIYI